MASTPNHAIQGALLTLIALKMIDFLLWSVVPVVSFLFLPMKPALAAALMTIGALLGAAPDIIGAIGRTVDGGSWRLYTEAHTGYLAKELGWIPQYRLHLEVDKLFHQPTDGEWWPRLWYLELFFWGINALTIWILL